MGEMILVVDDEEDLVATLEFNLQREGYRTRAAYCGQQALDIAFGTPRPALVLLDLMLPDMSGTEVCRRMRTDPQAKNLPIVMLTARAAVRACSRGETPTRSASPRRPPAGCQN